MSVYINLLLEKRTQIKPENNDRFAFNGVPRCYTITVCLTM